MQQKTKHTNNTSRRRAAPAGKNKTGHLELKKQVWLQQHNALQAQIYRLTLMHPERSSFNLGKGKDGKERFFTVQGVIDRLPLMAAKNSQGYNVYVTPISEQEHYIVLDDTTQAGIDELRRHGFKPCLVQESSPGNFQAIFRSDRQSGFEREQSAANAIVCRLNMKFGDPAFSGVIHPFRLAGFANRKKKHKKDGKYPFVTIHEARNVKCSRLSGVIDRERLAVKDILQPKQFQIRKYDQMPIQIDQDVDLVDIFLKHRHHVVRRIQKNGLQRDESRIDFRVARLMLENGYARSQVEQAIRCGSPSVFDRHYDVGDYVRRTVGKAAQQLERNFSPPRRARRGCVD